MKQKDTSLKKRKPSRQTQNNAQADGLTYNALKMKYEAEFKKRLAQSNAQVKTKKCGGHVDMIQPVVTKNNIPFLINDSKVRTLNRYLESSEPQVPISQAYIANALGRPQLLLNASEETMTSIITSVLDSDDEDQE